MFAGAALAAVSPAIFAVADEVQGLSLHTGAHCRDLYFAETCGAWRLFLSGGSWSVTASLEEEELCGALIGVLVEL